MSGGTGHLASHRPGCSRSRGCLGSPGYFVPLGLKADAGVGPFVIEAGLVNVGPFVPFGFVTTVAVVDWVVVVVVVVAAAVFASMLVGFVEAF